MNHSVPCLRTVYSKDDRHRRLVFRVMMLCTLLLILSIPRASDAAGTATAPGTLHEPLTQILRRYVSGYRFDYESMAASPEDLERLNAYVDFLEAQDPSVWPQTDALAFWINLYNAATLELVLTHYPVSSIKDIGDTLSSPWNTPVVAIGGIELSLNNIENDIIRPTFKDARIHFALNCASIGCPPLADRAYEGETLDSQLDLACERALNDDRWVEVTEKELRLSKIFDWYRSDFDEYAGTVRDFIVRYRDDETEAVLDRGRSIRFKDYDWNLNSRIVERP